MQVPPPQRSGGSSWPPPALSFEEVIAQREEPIVDAMLVSLARRWPLQDALRFGIAAGAAALLRPGTELCRREDTERLYGELAA